MVKEFGRKTHRNKLQLVFREIYFVVSISKSVAKNSALIPCPNAVQPSADLDKTVLADLDKTALANLVKDKNLRNLGPKNLISILESGKKNGISSKGPAGIQTRVERFGSNTYEKAPVRSVLSFVAEAFKDFTILILLFGPDSSLGFGIKDGWYDGGSIILAVALVLAVSNLKQISRQFLKLSSENSNIKVEVLRDGRRQAVSIHDVVVGDVVCLSTGDHIPADGLFLVDESSMTGEVSETDLSGTKVGDVFCQLLNELNARKLFIGIVGFTVLLQVEGKPANILVTNSMSLQGVQEAWEIYPYLQEGYSRSTFPDLKLQDGGDGLAGSAAAPGNAPISDHSSTTVDLFRGRKLLCRESTKSHKWTSKHKPSSCTHPRVVSPSVFSPPVGATLTFSPSVSPQPTGISITINKVYVFIGTFSGVGILIGMVSLVWKIIKYIMSMQSTQPQAAGAGAHAGAGASAGAGAMPVPVPSLCQCLCQCRIW